METIRIWINEPDKRSIPAQNTLHNVFSRDEHVRQNARVDLVEPSPGEGMGVDVAVIELAVTGALELAKLALDLYKWYVERGDLASAIAVRAHGETTILQPVDLADPEDKNYTVRRALAGAPDPRESACILIGVSQYGTLRSLPAVEQNVKQVREVLQSPRVWGLAPENVIEIDHKKSVDAMLEEVKVATRRASGTLLFYFAGHGIYGQDGLRLALPGSTGKGEDHEQSLRWQQLADIIRAANVRRRIAWLHCCYAELAASHQESVLSDVVEGARDEHIYLLAAAQKHEEARSPRKQECSAFTGELLEALRKGVVSDPTPEFMTLNTLHEKIRSESQRKDFPDPKRHDPNNDIGDRPQFHNNGAGQRRKFPRLLPAAISRHRRPPGSSFKRVLAAGAVTVFAVAAALGVSWLMSDSSGPALGGLDLGGYCSLLDKTRTENFFVSGSECYHRVDLDSACRFSYPGADVQAVFKDPNTPPDPNSAHCYTSGKSVDVGGIQNMPAYCATLSKATDVEATATDPGHENTWICRVAIDYDAACDTQYLRKDLEGRFENGAWRCYQA